MLSTRNARELLGRTLRNESVVNLGLASNLLLALIKLSAGIFGHSKALLADGINSISDVVYFLVVRILVKLSAQPADEEHPYGHHQFESIAALVVGSFVITTALAIFWDSINSAFDMFAKTAVIQPVRFFTLWAALATIIIKIILMMHARAVSRSTGSIAVAALASDHRNDIFASLGAGIGIIFGLLGYTILDPIAGAMVAAIVAKTGIGILRESANELMDTIPSSQIDNCVRSVLSSVPEILSVESVHAHRFGPYIMANITIGINGQLTVSDGNKLAHYAESLLYSKIEMLRRVYIHYHPPSKNK
ncbi:MAG: hypothetical protein A2096_12040 [Spirochaetes bacterium GWF1_41_5]|nr:MAG: hypothetical protein A2096_12040 [Spirochaetes bacterium GWF1_41_5]